MGSIWPVITVVGPLLLIGFLIWAFFRNRASASRTQIERAERGARDLREDIEEDNAPHRS